MSLKLLYTAVVGLVLGLVVSTSIPAIAQVDDEEEDIGRIEVEFKFRGILNDINYQRTFGVKSSLTRESDGMVMYRVITKVSFRLVVDNTRWRFPSPVLMGIGTSPSVAATEAAEEVALVLENFLMEIYDQGAITMDIVDRVLDSLAKEWISSLGILLSPSESNEVFQAVLAGICESIPECSIGDACDATSDCLTVLCVHEGVETYFTCPAGQLICPAVG